MQTVSRSYLAVVALMLACEPAGDEPVASADAAQGTVTLDAGTAPALATDAAPAVVPLDAAPLDPGNASGSEAGSITLTGKDAGTTSDASGPLVLTIPTRSVVCGGSECTTTNNRTCCQGWSRASGFDGAPACVTKAQCESDHTAFSGETNRVVESDCDEPSDCSGGQVCCFVRFGRPVTADLFSTEIVGPGASRLCLDLSACNAGTMSVSGVLGIPIGVVACKSAADCKDGTTCMPEQADSASSGKGSPARAGVMVCR